MNKKDIVRDYQEGMLVRNILHKHHIHHSTLKKVLEDYEITGKRSYKKIYDQATIREIIGKYANGQSIKSLSLEYHYTPKLISSWIKDRDIKIRRYQPKDYLDIQESIIQDYLDMMTVNDIERKYHISHRAIKRLTGDIDRGVFPKFRIWEWDFDFFNKLIPEVAYWAGFLYADGCLSKTSDKSSWLLRIELKPEDRCHLEKFCKAIQLDISVIKDRKNKPGCFMTIYHKNLSESLKKWGIVEKKTFNWHDPNIPDDLIPHFIRGYLDGDGHFSKNSRRISVVSYNEEPLRWLLSRTNTDGKIVAVQNSSGHINYRLSITREESTKLLKFCDIKNDLKLDRKYLHIDLSKKFWFKGSLSS